MRPELFFHCNTKFHILSLSFNFHVLPVLIIIIFKTRQGNSHQAHALESPSLRVVNLLGLIASVFIRPDSSESC